MWKLCCMGNPMGFFVYDDHNDNLWNSCNLLYWVEKIASLIDTIYPPKKSSSSMDNGFSGALLRFKWW
jgi:hypothetical protein